MSEQDTLLWLDVETSGLRPGHDLLLEVGVAVTGPDLTLLAARSWTVHYRSRSLDTAMSAADAVVREMHEASGLWRQCAHGDDGLSLVVARDHPYLHPDVQRIAVELLDFTETYGATLAPLAGSSVHFDAEWLSRWFPGITATRCAARVYRRVDVSSWKEALNRTRRGREIVASRPEPARKHRALPDLVDSISELRHYLTSLGLMGEPGADG